MRLGHLTKNELGAKPKGAKEIAKMGDRWVKCGLSDPMDLQCRSHQGIVVKVGSL